MGLISLVVPVYNEEGNIAEVYRRLSAVLASLRIPYEIIFVDDGSRDMTYGIIKGLREKDRHLKLIKFSKNCGQVFALLAGFEFARGETVITMDADLQNDPADIPKLLEKINAGFDLVNGWRGCRKDSRSRKLISGLERWLIAFKTGVWLHDYGSGFFALKQDLVKKINVYGAGARFIKPLAVKLAGSFTEVKVGHYPRGCGRSKYNFLKIAETGLDFLIHFKVNQQVRQPLPCNIEEIVESAL